MAHRCLPVPWQRKMALEDPRGSWTPGCCVGIPWGLRLRSRGAVQMGMWVTVSLPQGWPGAAGAHPGRLPSGPDRPGDDGEMTLRWPEPGLARHSRRWQGQARGALGGLGDSSLCWPRPPALLWEGRAVLLPCTVRGPELAPGGGKDVGGGKRDFFPSLGGGREAVRIVGGGWGRRGGKRRLCKKRNWSYRRSVPSWLCCGLRVASEGPWERAHPLSEAKHRHVPWEVFGAAQIPQEPN